MRTAPAALDHLSGLLVRRRKKKENLGTVARTPPFHGRRPSEEVLGLTAIVKTPDNYFFTATRLKNKS
ncbi:Atp-Binding Cassette Sub-Family G Member 1 [Manis pentadactyla]|nr:Atp-Binding Cassette Sub-Family G Member 1 [Manis pentadactyla]